MEAVVVANIQSKPSIEYVLKQDASWGTVYSEQIEDMVDWQVSRHLKLTTEEFKPWRSYE